MSRPSAAFTHDELCDEFDWMYEFNSRMSERIRNDPDVHNLVAYVEKLESQNKELRELASVLHQCLNDEGCEGCPMQDDDGWCVRDIRLRELQAEVEA